MRKPSTAVVIAGAVARGAYEAAVMATLLPKLLPDLRDVMFFGTSAGAINAVLWAGFATPGRSVQEVGEKVKNVWAQIDDTDVFSFPVRSLLQATAAAASSKLLGLGGPRFLLDTKPLRRTVDHHMAQLTIADNLRAGSVAGVGVAATFCGKSAAGARSHLFYQAPRCTPQESPSSAVDYIPAAIDTDHVLASSSVPCLFPSIRIGDGWYVDGGVRLNTPIAPALAFGVERVIIISSHSAVYPEPQALAEAPLVSEAIAMILHSVLADRMIEDLRSLRRTNRTLAQASAAASKPGNRGSYTLIEHIVVSPPPGVLARIARASIGAAAKSLSVEAIARSLRHRALDRLLLRQLGGGPGVDELLSYFLFDPGYFAAQFEQGHRDASAPGVEEWRLWDECPSRDAVAPPPPQDAPPPGR